MISGILEQLVYVCVCVCFVATLFTNNWGICDNMDGLLGHMLNDLSHMWNLKKYKLISWIEIEGWRVGFEKQMKGL